MVQIGLQVLLQEKRALVEQKRVGLVTHAAAVLPDFTSSLDALLSHGIQITALFGPEHGLDGAGADAAPIENMWDAQHHIPIYSLYGASKQPTPEMLHDIDVLVFDMQDVGARFYTFISTLAYVLRAAAAAHKPIIVLDRPNPINGIQIEGPFLDAGLESFISHIQVPIRHALTTAEMAQYIVRWEKIDVDLTVVPMRGWQRTMWFDETGLPWVPLSPAMPHLSTATVYPGACLVEGTNLSEGRGTALPFETIGAPWLDGFALAHDLNALALPGVRFRTHSFVPTDSKHRGIKCGGVQLHVTDRNAFRPVFTGIALLSACRDRNPDRFEFLPSSWEGTAPHLDLLTGTPLVREGILQGLSPEIITAAWQNTAAAFEQHRLPDLMYPENS